MHRRNLLAVIAAAWLPVGAAFARGLKSPEPSLWTPFGGRARDGFATGPNGKIAYHVYGKAGATPIVVLHGGPAAGHNYMRPYAALATDREVVLYDQSGCGDSARPEVLSNYTVERYVAELEALRTHLGYSKMILVGHSWGGMLAIAYAEAHKTRVAGLVLAGTSPRLADFKAAAERWIEEIGPEAVATVRKAEASGKLDDPAYAAIVDRYYHERFCRLETWPDWLLAEIGKASTNPVYAYLNGPSEFQFNGALSTMDLRPGLSGITAPTLVNCGEFDEAPEFVARALAEAIPKARVHVFEGLSHMSHIEDPAQVIAVTRQFISAI